MADTTSNEPPHSGAGARLEGPVDPGEFLRRQPPFDRLSDAAFRHVEASLEIVFAARGERVLERGGPPNEHLFVIRKGSMRLMADGRVIELLEEGECFGFPSLMAQTSATSSVIADEESLLLRIPKATFDQLMSEPEFAGFFVEGLHERLRQAVNIETPTFATDLTTPASSLIFGPPVFVPVDATVASAARTMSASWRGVSPPTCR
jgi:CBS domain-containing protein